MTFAQWRNRLTTLSQNVSPSLSDAYLYYVLHKAPRVSLERLESHVIRTTSMLLVPGLRTAVVAVTVQYRKPASGAAISPRQLTHWDWRLKTRSVVIPRRIDVRFKDSCAHLKEINIHGSVDKRKYFSTRIKYA